MRGLGNQNAVDGRLDAVGVWVRESIPPMTSLQRVEVLQRVVGKMGVTGMPGTTGMTGKHGSAARPSRWMVASFMGLAVASAVLVFLSRPGGRGWRLDRALDYRVEGGEIGDGGYIRSFNSKGSASKGPALLFSEGTELHLMSGARGRLTSVDRRGARLAIEEGEAEVKVTPRPGARWLVDAGPFLITVKGTVFKAAWDGATEHLDIWMKHGLVSVAGPLADGVLAVSAGQHLSVDVRKKEVLLRQFEPAEPGNAPEVDGRSGPEVTPSEPGSGDAPPSLRPGAAAMNRGAATGGVHRATGLGAGRWAAALAAGNLDLILREAEQRGLRRSLARSSREDLAALSDAARYRRRDDLAHRGLLAERERFPRSGRASDSAFLLGRLAEAKPDGEARAIEWYDVYLKEAPSGAYSSEALGRKMVATKRLRGLSPARELASEYVQRYPSGTYAGAARALLDAP
jgi:hypothetical protein